jgi:hypothetical protein
MVGGKETGQRMMDYIIPGGAFTGVYARLAATGWKLNLQSAHRPGAKGGTNSKTKFTCPSCGSNAWGKPDTEITCTPCAIEALAHELGEASTPSQCSSASIAVCRRCPRGCCEPISSPRPR